MLKDKLQIILITYNRINALKNTFEQIFEKDSPIKDCSITILNNASTDGTTDLINEYKRNFPNINHIINSKNIGGNANICRAYEVSAELNKEYSWILCDDDIYNFQNWNEVERYMELKKDIICVADYAFPSDKYKQNTAYQILQLSFVPACIYRTESLTDNIMFTMYESTFSLFPHLALTIDIINSKKDIAVLSKPIVFNGIHYENKRKSISYYRGSSKNNVTERKRETNWVLGFVNILTLLNDKNLITECLEVSIPYKDIYGSWYNFNKCIFQKYFNFSNFNYFYEIFKYLSFKRKLNFILINFVGKYIGISRFLNYCKNFITILKIKFHNYTRNN